MEVRVRMCPRAEDVVLCRNTGQAQNCVGEAEQQESLPCSLYPVEGLSGTVGSFWLVHSASSRSAWYAFFALV